MRVLLNTLVGFSPFSLLLRGEEGSYADVSSWLAAALR